MSRAGFAVALMAILLSMSGCGQDLRPIAAQERPAVAKPSTEIEVSAYLFDAKLRMEGKPRSFRLEVFLTDSVAALAGRAYLGRGALRGRLTSDSLLVYFPSTDEYVDESAIALLSASECLDSAGEVNLLKLFTSAPDEVLDSKRFFIAVDTSGGRKSCQVSAGGCPWKIDLLYDRDGDSWRLRDFAVDNGRDIQLTAKRRTFKEHTNIDRSRFQVPIPATASLIRP